MNDQPRSEGDVPKDQTPKPENVGQRPADMGDAAAFDIIAELQSPVPQTPGEETPLAGKEGGQGNVSKEEKTDEKEPKEPEKKEAKPEEKPKPKETKPEEKPESEGEVYAAVGNQEFKTKEEMVEFLGSQIGYNRWLTGALKQAHPEWFDEKGKLVSSKIKKVEKAVEDIGDAAQKAAQGLNLNAKEKEVLRGVGIVFQEDVEGLLNKRLGEHATKTAEGELDAFEKDHPLVRNHYEEVFELLESTNNLPPERRMKIGEAWNTVKIRKGITEASDKPQDQEELEHKKKSGLDTQIPSSPTPQTGAPPLPKSKDFLDEVLGAVGIG